MEPGSRASSSVGQTSYKFANLMGTIIALLTLTVPLFAIAHFSSANQQFWRPQTPLVPNVIPDVTR